MEESASAPEGGSSDRADNCTVVDVVVLGAGITGLVSASVLLDQGAERVLVVDGYPHVGGNHLDYSSGDYTFDVGSFIFQDDSPFLTHFPELLERYVPVDPSWGKLTPQGEVGRYPFSVRDDFLAAGPLECSRILLSAAWARVAHRRMRNARDFARYWIGARLLHRSGLNNYMERFCGFPAERIDLRFAHQRMMWIAEYASVLTLVRYATRSMVRPAAAHRANTQLVRPREGFATLYAPAVQQLERRGATFQLGADLQSLRRTPGGFVLKAGERTVMARRVVSTIPIDHAQDLCGLPPARRLPTMKLISLFFSFSGERGFAEPILYNFSHGGAWKRLTVHSDFYGQVDGREYLGVEVVADDIRDTTEAAEKDFREHVADNGLFTGDLQLEGSHVLSNAYPIYTGGADEDAQRAVAALRAFGLESFGRQGGFEHQPTARVSTHVAEAALRSA